MNLLDLSHPADRNLARALQLQAQTNGDAPYLLSDDRSLTFAQVDALTDSIAAALIEAGGQPGDRYAMMMGNSVEAVLVALGVNKARGAWVPINTDYRGMWLGDSLARSRPRALFVDAALQGAIDELPAPPDAPRIVNLAAGADSSQHKQTLQALLRVPSPSVDLSEVHCGDTAAVLWTSGTTGRSKGVMQSHNAWIRSVISTNRVFEVREGDVTYNCLPLFNSAAWVANILPALLAGIPCAIDPQFSVSQFWQRIRHYRATLTLTLGAMHMFLWKAAPRPDDADNTLRMGNMVPMPHDLVTPFCQRFGLERIAQGYGQSEVMALLTRRDMADPRGKPNSLGTPADDLELALFDDDGNEAACGEVGEFCVRPREPHVLFSGYFDDPEGTAAAFFGDWFRTGDLGRRDADGEFFFVDRKKDCIRYKGRSVSSFEIEATARRHPAVSDVAAFGIASSELASESEIMIAVVPKAASTVTEAELARFINDNAPYYIVPRYIELVTELPYTPTRKVQKFTLRERGVTPATWDRLASDFVLQRSAG